MVLTMVKSCDTGMMLHATASILCALTYHEKNKEALNLKASKLIVGRPGIMMNYYFSFERNNARLV